MTNSLATQQPRRWLPRAKTWSLSRWGIFLVIASVAATVLLRIEFEHLLEDTAPLLAFVLPVSICAILGGFWVGLLATLGSAISGYCFFIDPVAQLDVTEVDEVARIGLFVLVGLVISIMSEKMHREVERAVSAEQRVVARELQIREANARLQLTLDAAGAGTWDWDVIQDKLVWSATNYDLFGIDPDKQVVTTYKDWLDTLLPGDRAAADAQVRHLMFPSKDDQYRTEYRITHPDKGERWILGLGRINRDERGRPERIRGICIDITDRKRVEESERAARTEAERTNRLKDEFLSTISHELRTPLTAILGWSQILRRHGVDHEKLDRGLDVIDRNARSLTQLVSDLLDVGRIVAGKLKLETSPLDLGMVTTAAVDTVRPLAQAKRVHLVTHVSPIDDLVLGDASRIQQVVWNLVSNAIKFTPRDGRIEIRVEAKWPWATLTVRDTGEGIASEFLPHLFERFRQQDSSSSRAHGGLGLGLAIVKHLVELHGGRVRAESDGFGRGATFTVELPLASAFADTKPSPEPRPTTSVPSGSTLGGIRVLLVEDEVDTREFVQRVLEESAAEVVSTGSAAEALNVIEGTSPDVLVSDIGMPGMDGYALLRAIRTRYALPDDTRTIPALALTAFARTEDRQRAFDAGYAEHLAKPIDPVSLVTAVARLCAKSLLMRSAPRG